MAAEIVAHPWTSEPLALADASTAQLAEALDEGKRAHERIRELEAQISSEIRGRLDRSAAWTQHVGDPDDQQWTVECPSPTAGTEVYPPDALRTALVDAVDAGGIGEDAASKALARRLVLELAVPWDADLQELALHVKGAVGIQIAGFEVDVVKAEPVSRSVAAGIKALRKLEPTHQYLDDAVVKQPVGERRVRVTLKTRGSS